MEFLYDVSSVIQIFGIGLGLGSSTIAVSSYFVALADGNMDATERKMMGAVYAVLRVAMLLILITTIFEGLALFFSFGWGIFGGASYSAWTLVAVLFINAILMTKHVMPMFIGPPIQASSWYSLAFMSALFAIGSQGFSYITFLIYYILLIIAVTIFVNGMTYYLKNRNKPTPSEGTIAGQ